MTGRLLVVDTGWSMGGVCAEIGCLAAERWLEPLEGTGATQRPARHPTCRRGLRSSMSDYPDVERIRRAIVRAYAACANQRRSGSTTPSPAALLRPGEQSWGAKERAAIERVLDSGQLTMGSGRDGCSRRRSLGFGPRARRARSVPGTRRTCRHRRAVLQAGTPASAEGRSDRSFDLP